MSIMGRTSVSLFREGHNGDPIKTNDHHIVPTSKRTAWLSTQSQRFTDLPYSRFNRKWLGEKCNSSACIRTNTSYENTGLSKPPSRQLGQVEKEQNTVNLQFISLTWKPSFLDPFVHEQHNSIRHGGKDDIKTDLRETGCGMDWIQKA